MQKFTSRFTGFDENEIKNMVNHDEDFRELWEDYTEIMTVAEANEMDIKLTREYKILQKELEEEIRSYLNTTLKKK